MGETSKECLKDRVVLNFENNTFVTQKYQGIWKFTECRRDDKNSELVKFLDGKLIKKSKELTRNQADYLKYRVILNVEINAYIRSDCTQISTRAWKLREC